MNILDFFMMSMKNWENCDIYSFIIIGIFGSFINIFGTFLNIIAIIAFIIQKNKNTTSFMLIGLELADSIFLITHFISISLVNLTRYSIKFTTQKISPLDTFDFINIRQKLITPILMGSMMISSWHVMFLTIERYIAICHPHKSSKITLKTTFITQIIIYIFSYLLTSTYGFENKAGFIKHKGIWNLVSTDLYKNNRNFKNFLACQYVIFQLIIPISTIFILTLLIIKVIYLK